MWEVDGGEVRRGRNFDKRSGWMEEKSVCKVAEATKVVYGEKKEADVVDVDGSFRKRERVKLT
jgi:hypothetical protein